ncbi:S41 family peptidase [Clostridium sp. SHJSY1]|uniref:S41 family peptidase n=1 Tax=Clostridium sp. SHJSY1 TaxID=2942483 RepID=UPI0028762B5A|nr:S41 family peptidase [Clostridium sp. SHJSY1]MDS0528379.1 S41 family peptidase [Clostridium sp. SHJSY1]
MNKKLKLLIIILVISLLFVIIKPFITISTKNTNITSKEWIYDINYLKEKIPKKHKNPFFNITQEQFNSSLDKLIEDVPNLNSDEIQVRINEIISSIGDAHTRLVNFNDQNTSSYPIQLYWFKDGYYIINTSKEYRELLGKKLISINNKDISEIVSKLNASVSQDNLANIQSKMPSLITNPIILKAYKIIDNDNCVFELADKDNGNKTSITLSPSKLNSIKFEEDSSDRISLIKPSDSEKLQYINSANAVYLRFDSCKLFNKIFSDTLDKINTTNAKSLIIDIRNNGGGNSAGVDTLLEVCKSIESDIKIYVIIGRKTFSSAIIYADNLKTQTNCTFYGEGTSGSPNHYGEVKKFTLPKSKLIIQYSTKYFNFIDTDEKSFLPDVYVNLSINDYLNNNDAILNKVLDDAKNL